MKIDKIILTLGLRVGILTLIAFHSYSNLSAAFGAADKNALAWTASTQIAQPNDPAFSPASLLASAVNFNVWIPLVTTDGANARPSASSIYWGAMLAGAAAPTAQNMQPGGVMDQFETRAKKKMSIYHWGQPWKMNGAFQNFYATWFDNVRAHGSIPLIDWGSWQLGYGPTQADFQLIDVYNGTYDAYIRQWATDAKNWGHPFFLRFDWEMNGTWQFPWAEQINGNQPGDYIKAWRHVHDIFTSVGASNVTWVWCPNVSSPISRPLNQLYPGDAYVDWTCMDGYNKDTTWLNFNQVFNGVGINWIYPTYNELLTVAPNKPIMIGETASLEAGDGGAKKAAWITDALTTQLPKYFPKIKAFVWFNWDDGDPKLTFPIESSQASINAFATGIGSNYYAANVFGNLNTSPIPIPK
jgi:hypothetical protein